MAGLFDGNKFRAARLAGGCRHHSDVVAALELQEERLGTKNALGVDDSLVCKWERGRKAPGIFYGARLCLLFGAPEEVGFIDPRPRLLLEIATLRKRFPPTPPPAYMSEFAPLRVEAEGDPPRHHQTLPAIMLAFAELLVSDLTGPGRQPHSPGNPEESMRRRAFSRYLALLGGAAALHPDLLSTLLRGVSNVDEVLLDRMQHLTEHYMGQWDKVPPQVLLPAVSAHLDALDATMNRPQSASVIKRLKVLTSEAAVYAGLLCWYMQNRVLSERYLGVADGLAQVAAHDPVRAIVLIIRADFHSAVQTGGRIGSAISRDMLDAATNLAGPSASVLRAWALLRRAEEHAVIGQVDHCHRYLDQADHAFSSLRQPEPALFTHWNLDIHAAFRGNCEQLLGQYRLSADILTSVLQRIDPQATSNRASVQADLGAVYAQLGEVEQACKLLSDSLASAVGSGLHERIKRVSGIRDGHLSTWHDHPLVRQLGEQIQAIH